MRSFVRMLSLILRSVGVFSEGSIHGEVLRVAILFLLCSEDVMQVMHLLCISVDVSGEYVPPFSVDKPAAPF
jgi:hypothetical protein